jgi:hypothetical protein
MSCGQLGVRRIPFFNNAKLNGSSLRSTSLCSLFDCLHALGSTYCNSFLDSLPLSNFELLS